MGRPRRLAACAAWMILSLELGCSLLQLKVVTSEEQHRQAEEEVRVAKAERRSQEDRRAAESAAREQAILEGISRLRAEIAAGGPEKGAKAIEFAKLVASAEGTAAAKDGRVAMNELVPEATSYLEKAIVAEPSMDLFDAMLNLPSAPGLDAVVVRACQKVRPKVSEADLPEFVGACLDRADGDAKQLKWPGAQRDLAAYKKANDARLAAEATAKEEQVKLARYIAAAVFASGRCNFSDCLKDGWTVPSPDGDIQVRCDFQDCFKNGWSARYPDGREARTRCSFQNCMKDGWETTYPDGQSSRTRCSFQNCLKDGWETELPGGGQARTRCSFQDCSKDGWETELPGGGRLQCRCNFQKCFENGASCG